MKTLLALLLALAPLGEASCAAPSTVEAPLRTVVLSITGMTCAVDCPPRVQAALASVPGVESVVVDYDTRTATVRCASSTRVEALCAAALRQGFGAAPR